MSVNRAAIFLNRPCAPLAEMLSPEDARRLRSAAAIGFRRACWNILNSRSIPASAGRLSRLGRILRRDSDEARADAETQKEFELLGAQVAVPMPDRERHRRRRRF